MRKTKNMLILAIMAVAMIGFQSTPASAVEIADGHKLYGYYQLWASLSEDYENDAVADNGDEGEDTLFGFMERRARFGFKGKMADGMLGYNLFTEWANNSVSILDYWITVNPSDTISLRFGRFRPMYNYEGQITSSAGLQDMERSQIGKNSSGYMFPMGSFRDLGAEIKIKTEMAVIKIAVTNGVGNAKNAVGGGSFRPRSVRSNAMLDAMYSIGVIAKPAEGLVVHAGYAMNKHDNAVLNTGDGDTVIDIDRTAYSAGLLYKHESGLWFDAEYMFGARGKDDLDGEDETKGYFVRVGFWAVPKTLDLNVRYDVIEKGKDDPPSDTQTTVAARYFVNKFVVTLEYAARDYESESKNDDTALRARFQLKF